MVPQETNLQKTNLSTTQLALWVCAQTKRIPVLLWGIPGSGKTSHVDAAAEELNMWLETVILSIREPSDMAGLPVVSKAGLAQLVRLMDCLRKGEEWTEEEEITGGVVLAPPKWAVNLVAAKLRGDDVLLFLDELADAAPSVQAAALRVVLDHVVGDLTVGSLSIVAAANRGRGWDLTSALANRFCHLEWEPKLSDYIANRGREWPRPIIPRLPKNWEKGVGEIMIRQDAFLLRTPLHGPKEPEEEARRSGPWVSQRTIDMAAYGDAAAQAVGADKAVRRAIYNGLVGPEFTRAFFEYEVFEDLPDPREVLKAGRLVLMDRKDKNYVALRSVVSLVKDEPTAKHWEQAWKVVASVAEQKEEEVFMMVARHLEKIPKPRGAKRDYELLARYYPVLVAAGKEGV